MVSLLEIAPQRCRVISTLQQASTHPKLFSSWCHYLGGWLIFPRRSWRKTWSFFATWQSTWSLRWHLEFIERVLWTILCWLLLMVLGSRNMPVQELLFMTLTTIWHIHSRLKCPRSSSSCGFQKHVTKSSHNLRCFPWCVFASNTYRVSTTELAHFLDWQWICQICLHKGGIYFTLYAGALPCLAAGRSGKSFASLVWACFISLSSRRHAIQKSKRTCLRIIFSLCWIQGGTSFKSRGCNHHASWESIWCCTHSLTGEQNQCDKHQTRMNAPDIKKGASVFQVISIFPSCFILRYIWPV